MSERLREGLAKHLKKYEKRRKGIDYIISSFHGRCREMGTRISETSMHSVINSKTIDHKINFRNLPELDIRSMKTYSYTHRQTHALLNSASGLLGLGETVNLPHSRDQAAQPWCLKTQNSMATQSWRVDV